MTTPLAPALTDAVMGKLALTYGKRFTNSYDVEPEVVRAHWAQELAGLSQTAILYALERLPADYVPNVLQFRMLATQRPVDASKALPAPTPAPQAIAANVEAARAVLGRLQGDHSVRDPLAWAVAIHRNPASHCMAARKWAAEVLRAHGRIE